MDDVNAPRATPPPDAEIPKKPTDRLLINMSPGITHFSRSFISGQGFRPTGRAYFCRNWGRGGGVGEGMDLPVSFVVHEFEPND